MALAFILTYGLRLGVFVIILLIVRFILVRVGRLREQVGLTSILWISVFLAALFTFWLVLFQNSVLSSYVNIKFQDIYTGNHSSESSDFIFDIKQNIPVNFSEEEASAGYIGYSNEVIYQGTDGIVGDAAIIQLRAVPEPRRVYILVHPHDTQYWFVQSPMYYEVDKDYWEGIVYFGPLNGDCGLQYDLIVLASRDFWWIDWFRNRGLREGMKLDYLPVLNQSDMFIVTKQCVS